MVLLLCYTTEQVIVYVLQKESGESVQRNNPSFSDVESDSDGPGEFVITSKF